MYTIGRKLRNIILGPVSFLGSQSMTLTYLDVKLQVFIHGIYMVKDVVCNPWDDPHELRVMQLPLVKEKHKHRC